MSFDYATLFTEIPSLLTYLFLGLSILSLWFNRRYFVWGSFLLIAVILGLYSNRLYWTGILLIALYGLVTYAAYNAQNKIVKILNGILSFLISALLFFHLVPGFSNWPIVKNFVLSAGSFPYGLYLNFDKPLLGLFILAFGNLPLLRKKSDWIKMIKDVFPILVCALICILVFAYLLGYIRYDLKFNNLFFIWAINNLVFVCISEEVFFRGFIQRHLTDVLERYAYGSVSALVIASLLFGLAHTLYGIKYVMLATIAGLFYGIAYQKTKRIETSILVHFTLNLFHFVGFSYPALLSSFKVT